MAFWNREEKKRRRIEEETNREGHWFRDFSVRQESWPIIEHWAGENGYRLAALKGRRRLYQKGDETSLYQTFVDIRHDENRVVVSAWIQARFVMRALWLFMMPRVLGIEPVGGGWKGIRARRDATRELNSLLFRFRQRSINGSETFHITDFDLSSLTLSVLLLVPVHVFLIASLFGVRLHSGLSNALLMNLGQKLELLLVAASSFIVGHHFGVLRFFESKWVKSASVLGFSAAFTVLTVFIGTRTRWEMIEARITHHCVMHFSEKGCADELKALTPKEREALAHQISAFQNHLANRSDVVFGPDRPN